MTREKLEQKYREQETQYVPKIDGIPHVKKSDLKVLDIAIETFGEMGFLNLRADLLEDPSNFSDSDLIPVEVVKTDEPQYEVDFIWGVVDDGIAIREMLKTEPVLAIDEITRKYLRRLVARFY